VEQRSRYMLLGLISIVATVAVSVVIYRSYRVSPQGFPQTLDNLPCDGSEACASVEVTYGEPCTSPNGGQASLFRQP